MKRVGILMAGGSGERFWPTSRIRRPKQLLPLNTNKPLIAESIERINSIIPIEDIFIITNEFIQKPIRELLKDFPPENVIAEPYKRNTAPCLALACGFLRAKYGNEFRADEISVGVFTSDQKISPLDGFKKTVGNAFNYVEQHNQIATIGIIPSRPDTAYGYIQVTKDVSSTNSDTLEVVRFTEKPDFETAKQYVESGKYFWNSGMFFWRLDTFLEEISMNAPTIGKAIPYFIENYKGLTELPLDGSNPSIRETYYNLPDISIDYALMEKTKNIVVAKAYFEWDDIGSWDALYRTKEHDNEGNVNIGNNVLIKTSDSIIFNESTNDSIKVALLGLSNVVVVVSDDAILVCHKNEVQNVKHCLEVIKKQPDGEKWL